MTNADIAWKLRDVIGVDKKPFDPNEIRSKTRSVDIPTEEFKLLSTLPIINGEELFDFENGNGFFNDVLDGDQQCYVMEYKDRVFFIDTQGFNYARYVGEII